MDHRYKVGGYVKLAKLWERSKDAAVAYHSSYYAEKFRDDADKKLVGVYIDITGNKEIYKRPEMVHQMNMFEDFIGYQGSAVLDEPVREEDSFSKESMSQESEISENILLPDLAKQSESIEQQSGEIAERGMPT